MPLKSECYRGWWRGQRAGDVLVVGLRIGGGGGVVVLYNYMRITKISIAVETPPKISELSLRIIRTLTAKFLTIDYHIVYEQQIKSWFPGFIVVV